MLNVKPANELYQTPMALLVQLIAPQALPQNKKKVHKTITTALSMLKPNTRQGFLYRVTLARWLEVQVLVVTVKKRPQMTVKLTLKHIRFATIVNQ